MGHDHNHQTKQAEPELGDNHGNDHHDHASDHHNHESDHHDDHEDYDHMPQYDELEHYHDDGEEDEHDEVAGENEDNHDRGHVHEDNHDHGHVHEDTDGENENGTYVEKNAENKISHIDVFANHGDQKPDDWIEDYGDITDADSG